MRIVHLTTLHPPLDVRIFEKECRTLAAAGHEVDLLAFRANGQQDGIVFHSLGDHPARPGLGRLARRLATAWRSARRVPADVYHLHDPELIPVAALLRLSGRSVVYDAHEETTREVVDMHPDRPVFGRFLSLVWRLAERICGASVSAVVAATPSIARRFPRRKTVVVRNYPRSQDAEAFVGGPYEDRPPHIVYVGGLTEIRGARELVAAMARVSHPEVRLVVAGRIHSAELEAELRNAPGWEQVDFLGWLPRSGVAAVVREARVGVLPFLPVAGHGDALPNKLFEYMAAGLPVVASHFPLWREIVDGPRCGILVDPSDVGEIAGAIDRLLTDEREAAAMGARGRAAFESEYSWDGEAAKLLELYERLAERRSASA
jgi:glycosyltransferase involved in cell wall biosynthesis